MDAQVKNVTGILEKKTIVAIEVPDYSDVATAAFVERGKREAVKESLKTIESIEAKGIIDQVSEYILSLVMSAVAPVDLKRTRRFVAHSSNGNTHEYLSLDVGSYFIFTVEGEYGSRSFYVDRKKETCVFSRYTDKSLASWLSENWKRGFNLKDAINRVIKGYLKEVENEYEPAIKSSAENIELFKTFEI